MIIDRQVIAGLRYRWPELEWSVVGNDITLTNGGTLPSEEDIRAAGAEAIRIIDLRDLRNVRNALLTQTDWTQQGDVPESTRLGWQDYRQALRNITNTYASLNDVVWPEKPE